MSAGSVLTFTTIVFSSVNPPAVPRTHVRRIPYVRLEYVKGENGPRFCGLRQRLVIKDSKISFEPNYLKHDVERMNIFLSAYRISEGHPQTKLSVVW